MGEHDDVAGTVRPEDAFDAGAVAAWLRADVAELRGLAGIPAVRQFAGGASNRTYLLRWEDRELILRRPPAGTKAKSAHDMGREFQVQRALAPVFPFVPAMIAHCADEAVIGAEFYVMERLSGIILRRDFPPGVGLDDEVARDSLCSNAIGTLIALHEADLDASGLRDLDRGGGYVQRQVPGWTERFTRARTDDIGDFAAVIERLHTRQPADQSHTMIHNDFRFDNLVLAHDRPTNVVGVLDWELATVGDPLMDVGSALAYWAQADDPPAIQAIRLQPTTAAGMWTREQVWAAYEERRGLSVSEDDRRFYELFGTFRLAVIAQQIYYRFAHGETSNPKAGAMGGFVRVLDERCAELLH